MDTRGRHLLVEYMGCNSSVLDDVSKIKALMERAAVAAQTTIVESIFHPFQPQGVSGIVVIEESHLSIHTWPECDYAAVDFYTCGKGDPEAAHRVLLEGLGAQNCEILYIDRGNLSNGTRMQVNQHTGYATFPENSKLFEALMTGT